MKPRPDVPPRSKNGLGGLLISVDAKSHRWNLVMHGLPPALPGSARPVEILVPSRGADVPQRERVGPVGQQRLHGARPVEAVVLLSES